MGNGSFFAFLCTHIHSVYNTFFGKIEKVSNGWK